MRNITVLLLLLAVLSSLAIAQDEEPFALTVIHTNDTRAAHLPNSDGDGGVALLASVIKQIRREAPNNSLLLDAGDRFTGSLFHTQYQGQDQVQIMNLLGYDAMALGNHEFDNGDQVLADFINAVNFPIVSANIDASASAPLSGRILPYTTFDIGGRQVGLIGLTTAETTVISNPSRDVTFNPDYAAIANEQSAILGQQGINVIILLIDVGPGEAEALIPDLVGIDLVVGGRSQTGFDGSAGDYALQFETLAGETVYYVQADANTQFVGRIDLEFDADGTISAANGEIIPLIKYITPDPEAAALVNELYESVRALSEQPIGTVATAQLDGRREVCRVEECVLGNLIADSMRFNSGAQIALMNGGGIRANIEAGEITFGDVLTVQPFSNLLATFELSGANLIVALENGVSTITVTDGVISRQGLSGRFPQVSGIHYTYDPTQPVGSRIVSVEVEGTDGTFSQIDPDAIYTVAANGFMRTGGDGYIVFAEEAINPYDFGALDFEATVAYLASLGTVSPTLEGRITIVGAELEPLQ